MANIHLSPQKRKELEFLNSEKKKHPELFEFGEPFVESDEVLKSIGIEDVFKSARPKAYLKLWPQDFVVEEVAKDKTLRTVDRGSKRKEGVELSEEDATVYATLVKAGRSTFEIVDDMSKELNVERKRIGYAGIKDKQALTSQLISFRETDYKAVEALDIPGVFLKDIYT
ncbi:MAG: tRNA pseudouridine(13) synthase TruD, partial [Candidatus Spechtbacterales bacterium]|nr:tRNA pseudouridine(13) synthase TruD [Candidatus Spechtbacterales bacterium]